MYLKYIYTYICISSYASKEEEDSSEDSSEDKQFDINELKALSDMHNTDAYQVFTCVCIYIYYMLMCTCI
jgi:hypothetical protein